MKVKIIDDIFWNTNETLNPEALNWIQENVYQKLAYENDLEGIQPSYDQWDRPERWIYENENCIITLLRAYINNGYSWAADKDILTVKAKENE